MTQCECELAGFCKRHNIEKDEISHQLCRTNQQAFMIMEKEAGIIDEQEYYRSQNANRLPSIGKQISNLARDTAAHIGDGLANVRDEEFDRRIKICESCPLFMVAQRRCSLCGCYMDTKAQWRTGKCPDSPPRW